MSDEDTRDETPRPSEQHMLIPSLRIVGGELYRPGRGPIHELSLDYSRPTVIGRLRGCDWTLPHETVSRRAVVVTRAGLGRIHVAKHDQATKEPKRNKNAFAQSDLGPGDVFSLGSNHIMVCNVPMRRARSRVAWWLGETPFGQKPVNDVDDVLATVTQGLPVLLLGEASLWPDQLARFLHESVSARSQGLLVEIRGGVLTDTQRADAVRRCHGGGALFVLPDAPTSRERTQVHALVAQLREQRVPLYVTARDLDVAQAVLKNDLRPDFRETTIAPLKDRRREMEALLVGMARSQGLPVHPAVFAPNLPAMEAHDWPSNLTELSEVTRNLGAMATRSVNETADYLGVARTTFKDWLKRYRFVATRASGMSRLGTEADNDEDEPASSPYEGVTIRDSEEN